MSTTQSGAVFELKPLGLADLLDVVWRMYRSHIGRFLGIAAVVYLPLGVLQIVAAAIMMQGWDTQAPMPTFSDYNIIGLALFGVVMFLFWAAIPVMQAAIAKAVSEYYLGSEPTLGGVYRFAFRRWLSLLGVALLTALIAAGVYLLVMMPAAGLLIGTAVFVEDAGPGVWAAAAVGGLLLVLVAVNLWIAIVVRLFCAALAVVLEDRGAIDALVRSWDLTRGRFWPTLVTLVILWLLVSVLTAIVVWPFQIPAVLTDYVPETLEQSILSALSVAAQLLFQPLHIVGTVLLYYDLRIRKEGFDLTMMAEAINEPALAAQVPERRPSQALYRADSAQAVRSEPAAGAPPPE
ncbi:MAG: hypothetical protein ACP5KN_03905, partial [Armatimonadota bacterium]